ncbi:hypothetical protein CCACVL1_10440 [Corchorus capsularis]|uniref:Uncharacterized protein n=1 Tax=Corchorus capsularis TaxID=210143 RepID=A0A1R3IR63_COCAP|nr:hypothetical protein CCACVL1_10440 [Corchorus capsularis]
MGQNLDAAVVDPKLMNLNYAIEGGGQVGSAFGHDDDGDV